MPLNETPLDFLKRQKAEIQKEIDRNEAELEILDARIAMYEAAKNQRPPGIPATWEPVLDQQGVVKGWMEPAMAARSIRP